MVSPEAVRRRRNKFEEYLAVLERIRGYSQEEFIADPERYGGAERFLQLAIVALTDTESTPKHAPLDPVHKI